jgi:hypothetical protein
MKALLVSLLAGSPLLAQQPAVVSGTVLDRATGQPIAGAVVVLGDDHRSSAPDGRFRAGAVLPGPRQYTARAIGYAPETRELMVLPGQPLHLIIELSPLPYEMDTLTVAGGPVPVLDGEQLNARGGDLATALNGWEGIVVSRTGHGGEAVAQVRGSAADEVLVLVDGFALNDPFTGRADLSRVPVRDVASVTLLRGVQSARAGARAMAGVIDISTRSDASRSILLGLGSDHVRRARLAGGAGGVSAALSVEALPDEYAIDRPSGGGAATRGNAGGEIWSLNARGTLGVDWNVRGSFADRGLPGTTVNPTPFAEASDRNLLVGISSGRDLWLRSSLQWLDTRARDASPPPGFLPYDSHTWGWGGTVEAGAFRRARLGNWEGEFRTQADGRHDRFAGDGVRRHATFSRAGLALEASLSHPGPRATWSVRPAVRLDWYTGRTAPLASGRVEWSLALGPTDLSGSLGNGVTVPALADLLFREGVGVAVNPDLRPERVQWEGELAVGRRLRAGGWVGSVRLGGFYGRIRDMILWTPDFRNVWSPGNFAVRRGGAEGSLNLVQGEITLSGSVTYASVRYDGPAGSPVPYRPRFSAALQAGWTPGPWRFGLGWNHLGTRYSRNREMNPLAPFDLIHLSVERRLGHLALRAELRDLADARPSYIAGFPAPGRAVHFSTSLDLP